MGCACKTKRNIDYINRTYGYEREKKHDRKTISLTPGIILEGIGVMLIQAILIPFFAISIIYKGVLRGKPISIPAFLNVRK